MLCEITAQVIGKVATRIAPTKKLCTSIPVKKVNKAEMREAVTILFRKKLALIVEQDILTTK